MFEKEFENLPLILRNNLQKQLERTVRSITQDLRQGNSTHILEKCAMMSSVFILAQDLRNELGKKE